MQVLCSIKENIYSFITPDYAKRKSIPSTRIMILLTKQINEQETTYRMTPAFLQNTPSKHMEKSRKNKDSDHEFLFLCDILSCARHPDSLNIYIDLDFPHRKM